MRSMPSPQSSSTDPSVAILKLCGRHGLLFLRSFEDKSKLASFLLRERAAVGNIPALHCLGFDDH